MKPGDRVEYIESYHHKKYHGTIEKLGFLDNKKVYYIKWDGGNISFPFSADRLILLSKKIHNHPNTNLFK